MVQHSEDRGSLALKQERQRHLLDLLLLGSSLVKDALVTVGADTVRAIESIHADVCLLGTCSLHPDIGMTVGSVEEASVKRAMIAASAEIVGLTVRSQLSNGE